MEEKNGEISYSSLAEKERTLKKTKERKINQRGCAWFLGIVSLLGIGFKVYDESNFKFNDEVRRAYVEVIDELSERLPNKVVKLNGIRLIEPTESEKPAEVQVFATIDEKKDGKYIRRHNYYYELAYEYYKSLKSVEKTGDILKYVEVLKLCFKEMTLTDDKFSSSTTNFELNSKEAQQFNELFNLDKYGLEQIGFLPQYVGYSVKRTASIDVLKAEVEEVNKTTIIVKGLSFVEVNEGQGDNVLPDSLSGAILNKRLNKNNIKIYETDFEFTYETSGDMIFNPNEFITVLKKYFAGEQVVQNLKVVPTYAHEIDLTSFRLQENSFDFEPVD